MTHFFGRPQGPPSSSFFSFGCAGGAAFVVLAPVVVPCSAGLTPFSVVAAAAADLVSWALPSSHAKLTLETAW
jgi:hypothetical protein